MAHHRGAPAPRPVRRTVPQGLLLVCLAVAGCSEPAEAPGAAATVGPFPDAVIEADVLAQWSRSCALCHADGTGGAPRVGDGEAWAPRLAQGEAVLLRHTVEGLGNMPPLGYCMDCDREDFRALIRFMAVDGATP